MWLINGFVFWEPPLFQVFASDFLNDVQLPNNYNFIPIQEYLSFVNDGDFAVDGVLSDNPITLYIAFGMHICLFFLSSSSS